MTLSVTIDATGIHAPSYADVLNALKAQYRAIYGPDVYLENDSQDGQWLAVLAKCIHDANSAAISVYHAFSPATAQGMGLSRMVKINGIRRQIATASTVDVRLIGQAGTTIQNGVVQDANQIRWDLPAQVVIPPSGEVTVTAICQTPGAISAAAAMGAPVEIDAMLRRRQAASVALPSRAVVEGIVGAVAAVKGVRRYSAYENDTDTTDGNGLPSHSIAPVVEGGDAERIAQAIAAKKTPGAGTYGTTTTLIHDRYGIEHPIRFFRPVEVPVTVRIALNALAGYTSAVGQAIQQAVSDYVNARAIGEPLRAARLYVPANLNGQPDSETFDITALSIARPDAANARLEMPVAFNEAVHCAPSDVKLTVH